VGQFECHRVLHWKKADFWAHILWMDKLSDSAPLYALIILIGGSAVLFGLLYLGIRLLFG
jgi:hypothetical protein